MKKINKSVVVILLLIAVGIVYFIAFDSIHDNKNIDNGLVEYCKRNNCKIVEKIDSVILNDKNEVNVYVLDFEGTQLLLAQSKYVYKGKARRSLEPMFKTSDNKMLEFETKQKNETKKVIICYMKQLISEVIYDDMTIETTNINFMFNNEKTIISRFQIELSDKEQFKSEKLEVK